VALAGGGGVVSTLSTLEILKQARELLAQPGAWIRCTYARDDLGVAVRGTDSDAVCWCTLGALHRVIGSDDIQFDRYVGIKDVLRREIPEDYESIGDFNDDQDNVGPVLAVFDRAIARLESDQ
jgi:hypothetical protein